MSGPELAIMIKKFQEIEQANKLKTLESYLETAHDKQIAFHKATARIRYFLGGNRSGKTTAGAVEMLWQLLGRHPYRKRAVPLKGVVIAQDFENHVKNIIEPKFEAWAPSGAIVKTERNQNGAWRKVWFSTGSVLDIMSHDQDIKVFEGSDYDLAWFDEPPPKNIFNAVWRGLTDRGGEAYITGTPITGPWMYQEFKKAEEGDPLRWAQFVDSDENASNLGDGDRALGLKRLDEFVSTLEPEEREARRHGKFLQLAGLILKGWDRKHHLIPPFKWPTYQKVIESIDPHSQKPWAVSWIGITPNNKKILLRSGRFEGVIDQIANQILEARSEIETESGLPIRPFQIIIDNHASVPLWSRSHTDLTARRISVKEELENLIGPPAGGPRIVVAPKNVMGKIDLFKQWLHIHDVEGEKWNRESDFYAFNIPENERFVFEIENYIWDSKRGGVLTGLKDQPKKENDDILDSIMQVALTLKKTGNERPQILRTPRGAY